MNDEKESKWDQTRPVKTEDKQARLITILTERVGSLERIQAAQHTELKALYTGLRALQAAFDVITAAAPPAN